ncbi:myb-like protein X [Benincasa hispida]|uniref:myb-like protein X n=1 Tax=Benincasa hispida TaxID=102211 RepID=UPI001900199F|nr:myb-like protein X [Benincasa hispida]
MPPSTTEYEAAIEYHRTDVKTTEDKEAEENKVQENEDNEAQENDQQKQDNENVELQDEEKDLVDEEKDQEEKIDKDKEEEEKVAEMTLRKSPKKYRPKVATKNMDEFVVENRPKRQTELTKKILENTRNIKRDKKKVLPKVSPKVSPSKITRHSPIWKDDAPSFNIKISQL